MTLETGARDGVDGSAAFPADNSRTSPIRFAAVEAGWGGGGGGWFTDVSEAVMNGGVV